MNKLYIILPMALILCFMVGCQDKEAAKIEEQNKALIKRYIEERFAKMWYGAKPDLNWDIQEISTNDDEVSVQFVVRGTRIGESPDMSAIGDRFQAIKTVKFRIQDGNIVDVWNESDMLAFMIQLRGMKLKPKEGE